MPLKQLVNGKRITILYKEFDTARNALARLALQITLVQISVSICARKKAEHLVVCGWVQQEPITTLLRRLSLDSSLQYFLTNSPIGPSPGV